MISARNRFAGKVKSIELQDLIGKVKIQVPPPIKITCVITKEAVDELKIKKGDRVTVFVKATEVMILK
ncbi:MAG: TOBE domain-containing protein [Candidatus Odinarchaeum yellowstonii]|uniref:TOBE domain-containing protein n=1 Tax=Odinarchaeota yellowstonii (strain LCB_4) TaxID=1841599 RepID=A0AAF0ID62_ODILC|nr:MAG: TOBE domain-containing protein [Candidatus Odinarchaeum yellowstonii]